ncbi:MAG: hypothetical protein JW722_07305 [Demequinaceae bacterium]|nr:hypothetical protein [Demequinaceae bacterium]
MTRLARRATAGFVCFAALSGCSGPVPVHDTPGWGDLIASVQSELAAIEPDPIEPTIPPDPVDPHEGLTRFSPNAIAIDFADLAVGQCFLYPYDENEEFTGIAQVVPCEEPHYGEVYVTGEFTRIDYPDDLVDVIAASCEEGFEPYVGIDYWSSVLYYHFEYPTESGWDDGYKGWRCYAVEADYENVGSVQGSRR